MTGRLPMLHRVAVGVLLALLLVAVFAGLAPHGPASIELLHALEGPSTAHWFGTDDLGRDVFSRWAHGTRVTAGVAVAGVGGAMLLGFLLGAMAGLRGGMLDGAVRLLAESLSALPAYLIVLVILGVTRVQAWWPLAVLFALTRWPEVAMPVRGELRRWREAPFIDAARVSGVGPWRLAFRHLLPLAFRPAWVHATFLLPGAVLMEGTLSFLGFGVPPPTPSWGEMLAQAHRALSLGTSQNCWWLWLFPGLSLFAVTWSFQRLGAGRLR